MAALPVIVVASLLAFANGANDNFKGFATVWGAGSLSYRRALALATLATLAGAAVSVVLAEALARSFSGKGLVDDAVAGDPAFVCAAGGGAAAAVLVATRLGLPISTTHALIGGLIGAGVGHGGALDLAALQSTFVAPVLFSPLAAAALGLAACAVLRRRAEAPRRLVERVHILSAASVCFARGVNDTPKIAALFVAAGALDARSSAMTVTALMLAGGLVFTRRVADTMSRRMARIGPTDGLAANLITASLVLSASGFGLPVSTTHVSVGAIAGASTGAVDKRVLRDVALSWLATLPCAAAAAWLLASATP